MLLIEGDTGKGLYIADVEIAKVTRALRLVRRAFPDGRDITPLRGTPFELELTGSAARSLERRFPVSWHGDTTLPSLGIASVDSLHVLLGVRSVAIYARKFGAHPPRWFVAPKFPSPIYIAEATSKYDGIPEVQLHGGVFMGDWGGLSLERTASGYQFLFSRKWGDCLSGCINGHFWTFDVNLRTNRVTKIRDSGDPWPARDK